ncbi:MAG TPA: HAD family hydrolase [Acidimicrobiia bacterium]|nr:HAD family hydrolase [Acidimicrobiia bacterium]
MSHRPEAILFDAGGTLVLQDPAALSERLGHVIAEEAAFEAHYRSMEAFARRRQAGSDDSWAWWQERYFGSLGVNRPELAGAKVDNGYGMWHLPIGGTREALAELREMGIRTAVVSNSDGSVRQSLTQAGFQPLIEFVIDSHEAGVSKPDPGIFRYALDLLKQDPETTWYVGDSIFHDVGGALAAGLGRALLIDPFDLHPEYEHRIPGVAALPSLIRGLGQDKSRP